MINDPFHILLLLGITVYLGKWWFFDYKNFCSEKPSSSPLPGATSASMALVLLGITGALIILGIETSGEYFFGITVEQEDLTYLALLAIIAAGFTEELIFRGFLVIENRGRFALIGSIIIFSLLFALFHPYLWRYENHAEWWQFWEARLSVDFSNKAIFSTTFVLMNSLWFYTLRFIPMNIHHSLIPCFAAHIASNTGVFIIKLMQGHIKGLL
jgi:uncharacterized protein